MGKNEEESPPKQEIVLELKVYMHCKACTRTVLKALKEIKGVKSIKVGMEPNQAIVAGSIEPEEVVKKLKKKTRKRAEIISVQKVDVTVEANESENAETDDQVPFDGGYLNQGDHVTQMFSDENPNSCSIL